MLLILIVLKTELMFSTPVLLKIKHEYLRLLKITDVKEKMNLSLMNLKMFLFNYRMMFHPQNFNNLFHFRNKFKKKT